MALAKLQPRHREALIASIYEEKSTEVVADQLGLSENATRQLLFRARSAFKKALIGEVETAGMSAGQILSVAARKAAAESGKYITAAGAFLLVLAVSIGVLPNLNQTTTSELATAPTETSQPQATQAQPETEPAQSAPESEEQPASEAPASEQLTSETVTQQATEQLVIEQVAQVSAPAVAPVAANEPEPIFSEVSLASILATNVTQAGYYTNSYASSDFLSAGFRGSSVEVFGGTGISAFLDLDIANRTVFNVVYQMWVDGKRYYAVAENSSTVTNPVGSGYEVVLRASDFWVVDDSGNVFDQSPLANAVSTVRLSFDSDGNPVNASMKVSR